MTPDLRAHLDVAVLATHRAGASLREGPSGKAAYKADGGLVTDADVAADEACRETLVAFDPGYAILSEESGRTEGDPDRLWIVDPLDGTTNFVRGLVDYAVALALAVAGEPVLSVIHFPASGSTFTAIKGGGAFRDGIRLRIAPDPTGRPLVGTGFGTSGVVREHQVSIADRLLRAGFEIREPGSASTGLCRVAAGQYDGYLEFGIGTWDVVPGALLVREAGGVVTGWAGQELEPDAGEVLAATPGLHERLAIAGGPRPPI